MHFQLLQPSQPRRFRPYHLSNYSRGNFPLKHSELPPNAGAQAALKNPPFLLPLPLRLCRLADQETLSVHSFVEQLGESLFSGKNKRSLHSSLKQPVARLENKPLSSRCGSNNNLDWDWPPSSRHTYCIHNHKEKGIFLA